MSIRRCSLPEAFECFVLDDPGFEPYELFSSRFGLLPGLLNPLARAWDMAFDEGCDIRISEDVLSLSDLPLEYRRSCRFSIYTDRGFKFKVYADRNCTCPSENGENVDGCEKDATRRVDALAPKRVI